MFWRRTDLPRPVADLALARAVPAREMREVDRLGTPVRVSAGRSVIREDAPGRECFLVVQGALRVERAGETVSEVGSGEFVGEMALLDMRPRNATVTAVRESELLAFNRREFSTLMRDCPVLAARVRATALTREDPAA